MKHIVVCIPFARDYVYRDFMLSWTSMFLYARGKYNLSCLNILGPYIDANRDIIVQNALGMEPDAILFLDDDQVYPKETPEILLNHLDSGKLIAAGVTPRKETCEPMLWSYNEDTDKKVELWSDFRGNEGVIKIDGLGLGGVMIHPSVFYRLDYPFFKIQDAPMYQRHGEDITFFIKCKKVGIDVWVDLDLQFGHMVMREVRIGDSPR